MIGLGCMRLSTATDRDGERSIAVILAALDAGATLLDTADSYCHNEREIGHNERLIASALRRWGGDRSRVEVATKGGLRRPGGEWVPDGRAKHLREACDGSRRALDVDVIDIYQLHVVDPRTAIETSVRALAALQKQGKIRRIGLCNVTVAQIEASRRIAEISSVQVSLSVVDDENLRNGVAEYCRDHGIRLVAYRPLGGERRSRIARDPVLVDVASEHGVTPEEVALAWLMDLGSDVLPIPGATQVATARSLGRALGVRLTDPERVRLDERFSGRLFRVPRAERRPRADADGEVVLVMGMPGAGKSSVARELEAHGYARLNRDERGGSLSDLARDLDAGLAAGQRCWVLDNTYPSRKSRNQVIEVAWRHEVPVRCVRLATGVADAQVNAITRLIQVHGRLPTPDELREHGKSDARYFAPDAQFRYERTVEAPSLDEGFTAIDERPFAREPVPDAHGRAVMLEYDDVLCANARGAGPVLRVEDVVIPPGRRETLERFRAAGWRLFAQAWRPQIARGNTTPAAVEACFARTRDVLGLELELAYCPHDAGPPICWCRKPLPGLVLDFAVRHGIDPRRSIVVGRAAADRTMANKLGATYRDEMAFFGAGER